MIRKLGDTIVVDFCTHNPSTGAVSDADSSPTCEVFENDTDSGLSGVTVAKRSGKTGNYRVSIVCTGANGFEVGKSYNAIVSATVNSVSGKAVVCSFALDSVRMSEIPDAVQDETQSDHTSSGTFGLFVDSQISDISGGSGASADEVADAVWNELVSDHSTSGTFGRFLDGRVSLIPTNPLLTDDDRLDSLDTSISSRASQSSVDLIPTNTLLTNDSRLDALDTSISSRLSSTDLRLNSLDTSISSRSSQASVDLIPTNPLLDSDVRLDTLDATISTRLASDDLRLNSLDTSISSRASQLSVDSIPTNPLLTNDSRLDALDTSISSIDPPTVSEIADAVQDETRGDHTNIDTFGKYLDIEVSSVSTGGVTAEQIADAVQDETRGDHTNTGTFGSMVDTTISSRASQSSVDSIPTNTLLADDDRLDALDTSISSRASQSSVDLIPTNPLLVNDIRIDALDTSISSRLSSTDLRLNSLDTSISSRASQSSVDLIPTNPLLTNDSRLDALDTSISSRLSTTDLRLDALDTSISSRSSQVSVDLIPTNPLLDDDTRLNYLDASISQIESPPSVTEIADAVQDETRGDHTNTNTFGKYLDIEVSSVSTGGVTAEQIADAVWDETRGDHTNINTFGSMVDTTISNRASQSSVDLIPTNTLLTNDNRLDALDTSISSRLSTTDLRLNSLDTSISSRSSQSSVDLIPTNTLLTNDSRLDAIDTSISSRASQLSVDSIPTNPLLTNDSRLNSLDTSVSSRASQSSVDLIPVNPLLVDDTRLNYLDASISSIDFPTVGEIADAVQNEAIADHLNSGSTGELLQDIDNEVDFIHEHIENLAVAGAATHAVAALAVINNGVDSTGSYTSTYFINGTHHVITSSDSTIDMYYEFDILENGIPTEVTIVGFLKEPAPAGGDTISLQAYDWDGGWDIINSSVFTGIITNTNETNKTVLLPKHVGTGVNVGKVRIRFYSTSLETGTTLNIDQIYISYATILSSSTIADAVQDETQSNHLSIGTFGSIVDTTISTRASQSSVNSIPTNPLLTDDDRLNSLDTSISSRASQSSVDLIPTNPLLTDDTRLNFIDVSISSRLSSSDLRLDALDTSISSRSSQSSVDLIPTNPLLTDDTRLDYLDASISSIESGPTVEEIVSGVQDETQSDHTNVGTFGTFLDAKLSDISASSGATPSEIADAVQDETRGDHTNTGTFGKFLDIEVSSLATGGITADQIADAVQDETRSGHTNTGTFGSMVDTTISNRASQSSVDSIPTNPLLTNDSRLNSLDTSISSRASQSSVDLIPVNPLLVDDTRLNFIDVAISSRLASNDLRLNALDTSISSRASQVSVNSIPTNPLLTNDSRLNSLDTSISSRLASSDLRLNSLDTSISSRASQVSVNSIPTNPLLTTDLRLNAIDTSISSRASQISVNLIPTNPLLTNDSRLNYLDASISQIPDAPTTSEIADAVQDETRGDHTDIGTFGKYLDIEISSLATGGITADQIADAVQDETRAGHTNTGTFGSMIDTTLSSLDLTVDFTSIDEKLDLILEDTSELQTWWDVSGVLYEMLSSVALEYAGVGDRLIDFTVVVQDTTETVANVRISILSGNTPVAFGLSSLSGEFSALLFDGTYQITCAKVGYSFTTPIEIIVTQNGSVIIEASEIVVAAPFPAETCRIWEYCYDPEGSPLPSVTSIAKIVALPYDYEGKLISGEDVIGTYDPNTGLVYWDIVHGARVSFNIREVMVSVIRTVPETGSERLSELPGGC